MHFIPNVETPQMLWGVSLNGIHVEIDAIPKYRSRPSPTTRFLTIYMQDL